MKNLFIIAVLMITLTANSQISLNKTGEEIYNHFESEGIEYHNLPKGESYLLRYIDSDIVIYYYLNKNDICTSILVWALTEEISNIISDVYTARDYLKMSDNEWLIREEGVVYKILHYKDEKLGNFFYWR